ncbi:unnamed protein product [Adineta ricciae]|uniref:Uncharacterized protein n=1 Tax=Adineta ricciae TaxID=249248 RepID=A0A814L295_ADIRI|nr:unnamed protein product [Adineta ricciae]
MMESIPFTVQQRIGTEFEHILSTFNGLTINIGLLQLLKLLKHINSQTFSCKGFLRSTYLVNSYFNDGGPVEEFFIPLLRTMKTLLLMWIVFKGTTFYHLYYPILQRLCEEDDDTLEQCHDCLLDIPEQYGDSLQGALDNDDSSTGEGTSAMDDDFGTTCMEEDPFMIAAIDEQR